MTINSTIIGIIYYSLLSSLNCHVFQIYFITFRWNLEIPSKEKWYKKKLQL